MVKVMILAAGEPILSAISPLITKITLEHSLISYLHNRQNASCLEHIKSLLLEKWISDNWISATFILTTL